MDSLTQAVLGAAVGEAVLGRRAGRRAAGWGAALGVLPDLDYLVLHGSPVMVFTWHRSFSHSIIVLSLMTPLLALGIRRLHRQTALPLARWMALIWLVFATHVLLDCLTTYGTQALWPWGPPVSWSSVFIIDPVYTLLLLGGLFALWRLRDAERGHRFNRLGLALSAVYLAIGLGLKLHVHGVVADSLQRQGRSHSDFMTVPGPFNLLLWRAVAMTGDGYLTGYYSVLDDDRRIRWRHHPSRTALIEPVREAWAVERLLWFTHGFVAVERQGDAVIMSDLRMGYEPGYVFRFVVAEMVDGEPVAVANRRAASPANPDAQRRWIVRRIVNDVPPPTMEEGR